MPRKDLELKSEVVEKKKKKYKKSRCKRPAVRVDQNIVG
jgi:hypothetical protein